MLDEGTLRERFPEIPWDQPVEIVLTREHNHDALWLCRYCVVNDGLHALIRGNVPFPYRTRQEALDHIEREHHD